MLSKLSAHQNLQLVGPLSPIPQVLRRFGVDPVEVLTAAGLSVDALNDPATTIPYATVGVLLEIAAEKTRCPHFALEVGKLIRTASLGMIGELMRNAPKAGTAFLDFVSHQHRNAHGSVGYLLLKQRQAFLGYAVYQPNIRGYQFICDWAAMSGLSVVCELLGPGRKQVIEILLSRAEPLDLEGYQRAFGVKLHFNADQTALVFPRGLLDQPVAGADPVLRKAIEARIASVWHAGGLDTLTQLRRVIRVALLSGQVSGEDISRRMGISRRSLHRRLESYGVRFQDILDEVRCEFAQQLLTNTRLSIAEIALIVGYADPSILSRRFLRWTKVLPSKWRSNSLLQAGAVS